MTNVGKIRYAVSYSCTVGYRYHTVSYGTVGTVEYDTLPYYLYLYVTAANFREGYVSFSESEDGMSTDSEVEEL